MLALVPYTLLFAGALAQVTGAPAGAPAGWTPKLQLDASDSQPGDRFGFVSLSGDLCLVGAPQKDAAGVNGAGGAYVFRRTGGIWAEEAVLVAPDPGVLAGFGTGVAVSGETALIGAPGADLPGVLRPGAVYVFESGPGGWLQTAKLAAGVPTAHADFGQAVAFDGSTALVGSPSVSANQGLAHVFARTPGGWVEQAVLSNAGGTAFNYFGYAAAVDGDRALVGAFGYQGGRVFYHERIGGVWTEVQVLAPKNLGPVENFGWSLSLDGDRVAIGARLEDVQDYEFDDSGAAYIFRQVGGSWSQEAHIIAEQSLFLGFGYQVALAGDALFITSELPWRVHRYTASGGAWSLADLLSAPNEIGSVFGNSLAIEGTTALIGDTSWDGGVLGDDRGTVYVFGTGDQPLLMQPLPAYRKP